MWRPLRSRGARRWPLLVACALTLAACSRGGEQRPPTPLADATATPSGGIVAPPQTPRGSADATPAQRAESLLRRIAPTDADLPADLAPTNPASFLDAAGVAGAEPDPAAALAALQRDQFIRAYQGRWQRLPPSAGQTGAGVERIEYRGTRFATEAGASAYLNRRAAELGGVARTLVGPPSQEWSQGMVQLPLLAQEDLVRTFASGDAPLPVRVAWVAVFRFDSVVAEVLLVGVEPLGSVPVELTTRLDQRTAVTVSGP